MTIIWIIGYTLATMFVLSALNDFLDNRKEYKQNQLNQKNNNKR